MKEQDFISTIGYSGTTAIVDKKVRREAGSVQTLLGKGLFKAAFSKALYNENLKEQKFVLARYNELSHGNYSSPEEIKKLFGVFVVPQGISKVKGL